MSDFIISRRQLYILPTKVGWYFSLILLALFAIAVKFDSQSAFMMLFLLVSVGIIAMHYTHNNVIGLELYSSPAKSVFMGENAKFPIVLKNNSSKNRQAIWLICAGFNQVFNINSNNKKQFSISLPTISRGYLNCPSVRLSSQYPLGLFFCWNKRFDSSQRCIIYPQPLDLVPLSDSGINSNNTQPKSLNNTSSTDYSGMKAYQPGDRPRDIHWPSLAKTHKLITVQHEDQSSGTVNLSWFSLPANLNIEDKLSQLCFWVIDAEQRSARYQLEMPNHTIQFNNGNNHFHECLRVLALWDKD